MIVSFKNRGTEDVFDGVSSKAARKTLPPKLQERAAKTLDWLDSAVSLKSLTLPGLRLKALWGDRKGQHSIRINDRYRICFRWRQQGAEAVEILDYH